MVFRSHPPSLGLPGSDNQPLGVDPLPQKGQLLLRRRRLLCRPAQIDLDVHVLLYLLGTNPRIGVGEVHLPGVLVEPHHPHVRDHHGWSSLRKSRVHLEQDLLSGEEILEISSTGELNLSLVNMAVKAFKGISQPNLLLDLNYLRIKMNEISKLYKNFPKELDQFSKWKENVIPLLQFVQSFFWEKITSKECF